MKKVILIIIALVFPLACFAQDAVNQVPPMHEEQASPSKRIQNDFISISEELWMSILKSFPENEEGKKMLDEVAGVTLQEKAKNLNSELLGKWGNAFIVSDVEAERLLSDKYDDNKNKIEVSNCISEFAKRGVLLPFIFRYLIQEFQTGKLNSGLLLEFTARLFKEHLKQISR
jgi:hypothetical protein